MIKYVVAPKGSGAIQLRFPHKTDLCGPFKTWAIRQPVYAIFYFILSHTYSYSKIWKYIVSVMLICLKVYES